MHLSYESYKKKDRFRYIYMYVPFEADGNKLQLKNTTKS